MEIDAGLISATPQTGGFSWTLASRLGDMVRKAEVRFGPRCRTYKKDGKEWDCLILGVEFRSGVPQIWYPVLSGIQGNIVVQIGDECRNNPSRAMFQLANEVIHLLSPTGHDGSTVLEEGLGVVFAEDYTMAEKLLCNNVPWKAGAVNYGTAADLVRQLLQFDSEVIKRIRATDQPVISLIDADLIHQHCPRIDMPTARQLAARFS